MKTKLLILLKSVDGGTGTYLEGLLSLKEMFKQGELSIKVLVLERPKYRTININGYFFFPTRRRSSDTYRLSPEKTVEFIREIAWFKKSVRDFEPTIVLSSNPHSILISEVTKWLFGYKYKTIDFIQNNLVRVIEFKSVGYLRAPIKSLLTFFLNKSDEVVTVSKYLSGDVFKDFKLYKLPKTIPVILPPRILEKRTNIKSFGKKIVVSIARLDLQKDHETLLKAFQIVAQKNTDSELWIAGDGPLKNRLKLLSKRLGISGKTKFLGWIQDPERIMDKSNLFVLSSKWEGFPLSLMEAMSRGVPVVAADCLYGPMEILENNKYGILVPMGDINRLAGAITMLLTDRKMYGYYSRMAKKRSLNYSREKMLLRYKNIIDGFRFNQSR